MTWLDNDRGVSLIAAVFIIVVLAFMGVMFLTMISTSTLTSVNDLQSTQAFSIAEGGVQYEQLILAKNLDWYRSADPVDVTTKNLGPAGAFTASTNLPATMLKKKLKDTDIIAYVYSTNRFPPSGYLQVEDDVGIGAEFVFYGGIVGNTFTPLTRATTTLGSVGTVRANHLRGNNVYPVAQLVSGLTATCLTPTSITIKVLDTSKVKFLSAGTLDILTEEINYSGLIVASATNITLTGVQRCQSGTGPVTANVNDPVTPVLGSGVTASNQAEVVSIGTVGAAVRTVRKTIQR